MEEIAALYGVPESTPEAVGEVIASSSRRAAAANRSIKQGCIDAFAESP